MGDLALRPKAVGGEHPAIADVADVVQVADVAAEALLNVVWGNQKNRDALREAGGIYSLVNLLKGGPWYPPTPNPAPL